jgi:adenine-specific DNA methylase
MQKAFIESQFPIARLSAQTYRERKGAASQILPSLGKWWGRKPLILVRACILGMLMPASDNPKKDREIFLKILTMDDDGTWDRQKGDIPVKAWRDAAPTEIQEKYFGTRGFQRGVGDEEKEFVLAEIWEGLTDQEKQKLDEKRKRIIPNRDDFDRLPFCERIKECERPENLDGPSPSAWAEINTHLGTEASCLQELVEQLGRRMFGNPPRVGDAFCGGGSIPFEAARIGCEAFGSDLNPVAGLLTWASLNLIGGSKDIHDQIQADQQRIFSAADLQVCEWGIECNEKGERAEAYLYCIEAKPPGCDYFIPLSPSWVIAEKYQIVAAWERIEGLDKLQPVIQSVSASEFKLYKEKKGATVVDGRVVDPLDPSRSWSFEALRGPDGLRLWTKEDITPRADDVFQERLYCIRWINKRGDRRYAAPDRNDLDREAKVLQLLRDRFIEWQQAGAIPSLPIPEDGAETDRLFRERGWSHWHHLFTPRQLLSIGLISSQLDLPQDLRVESYSFILLGILSAADFNSKLCRWIPHLAASGGIGAFAQTFYNQALNTLHNWGCRSLYAMRTTLCGIPTANTTIKGSSHIVEVKDGRDVKSTCDLWITDPPYADAVNYHELGDFFLAWCDKRIGQAFPAWSTSSRAQLAVRGSGADFKSSMVDIYRSLSDHMPQNGLQMVMFTHQDPAVWADLGMILWASGLKATAAWTISTETDPGFKKGNYVQGTVCLVLRKRGESIPGFLFDVYPMVEDEVRNQVAAMQALDDDSEPNFNDSDYQLAAYAAALKVLTQYSSLDGKSVANEVFAVRSKKDKSDFEQVIERAITIACDALVPKGLNDSWRDLNLIERYYLRAVDIESRGERRKGMYEELARGFGVTDIKPLLKSDKANGTRVHTPSGFGTSLLAPIDGAVATADALPRRGRASSSGPHPFAATPLRHLLFAVCETAAADNDPNQGRQYLRDTFGQTYWGRREAMVRLLDWLAALGNSEDTADWAKDSEAARILAGRLRNDDA